MELIIPSPAYFRSFSESLKEWGDAHQDGAGIRNPETLVTEEGFTEWVHQLISEETEPAGRGFVTCSYRWMVDGDEYLGSIALRHDLNDYLLNYGGHIGYGVRPSARRQGHASQALAEILPVAIEQGLERVLVTCVESNEGSRRTIERQGGVLEDIRPQEHAEPVRRYWIEL
ncbi:GNAT family N-acetyltransferase [Arthrobacter sp. NPDC090010]|uniref:GNAT family N-acetyltransferase n=1 Tax=Arthrobacter sp. NPDC090010 TaxID=3363942 RepID=UPI00382D59A9